MGGVITAFQQQSRRSGVLILARAEKVLLNKGYHLKGDGLSRQSLNEGEVMVNIRL